MGRKTKQNKITNPELISQINPKNVRLMNDFLEYLRSIGKAESTVKAYTSDLYIFLSGCFRMPTISIFQKSQNGISFHTKIGCCGAMKTHLPVFAG